LLRLGRRSLKGDQRKPRQGGAASARTKPPAPRWPPWHDRKYSNEIIRFIDRFPPTQNNALRKKSVNRSKTGMVNGPLRTLPGTSPRRLKSC
jgi:hypothetical protein